MDVETTEELKIKGQAEKSKVTVTTHLSIINLSADMFPRPVIQAKMSWTSSGARAS